jgi:23S rRNA pseudouridine1911/1915/1917 synthase
VKRIIDSGHVRIPGKIPTPSLEVRKSMVIDGEIPEEQPFSLNAESIPLEVLYEDDHILAINKSAGMVVHPSFGHKSGTLVNAILAHFNETQNTERGSRKSASQGSSIEHPVSDFNSTFDIQRSTSDMNMARPGIVHRLDKGTTGVIVIAKNTKVQENLSLLFKTREVTKTYRAIVEGMMKHDEGILTGNIGRHPVDRKKMAVLKEKGREAMTGFKVISRLKGFSYIEAYPKTGRTHQIRLHLSHAGYPIVGDEVYGKRAKILANRPLLHAYKIAFQHPVKNTLLSIEAPIPYDIEEFLARYKI